MEAISAIIENITIIKIMDIPVITILFICLVLITTLVFKRLLTIIVIQRIEGLTSKTKTTLDDQLIAVLKNEDVAMPGISIGYWKAIYIPNAARSSGVDSEISIPSNLMLPLFMLYPNLPDMILERVDLPDPESPVITVSLSLGIFRDTFFKL